MCGYTLGSQSITYCLQDTVSLASGLNSRKLCLWGQLSHCGTFLVFVTVLSYILGWVKTFFAYNYIYFSYNIFYFWGAQWKSATRDQGFACSSLSDCIQTALGCVLEQDLALVQRRKTRPENFLTGK